MDFNTSKLCGCAPTQIISFNNAINSNDVSNIKIFDDCNEEYANSDLKFAYSLDSTCWSCYIDYNDLIINTLELKQDFYLKVKIQGPISKIQINAIDYRNYTSQLDSAFAFTYCDTMSSNVYNPYANMQCAIELQQHMSDLVCCMFGIPIYYFRLNPEESSKDITFKEYTLMNVDAPKQIKLMIQDGQMPSSKVEFNDFGFDFSNDWETEISKTMFATAFGMNAQPMEGDFIWIPMMKRMWQVSGAYEEKKDALMWCATTFKLSLAKYEEKGNIDLGETEELVNSFVKNKYDDLFGGEDNEDTAGTGAEAVEMPTHAADNLYPIYKSDATRKYVTCQGINIQDTGTYYKGTIISDASYTFDETLTDKTIIYQKQYCGDDITISFILNPHVITTPGLTYEGVLFEIGKLKVKIQQDKLTTKLFVNVDKKLSLELASNATYFVYIRWSKELNISEISAILYTYPESIPIYKLQSGHYYYDIDNAITHTSKWNIECVVENKSDAILHNFIGTITNIKVFNIYNDNVSEILQQYPTNNKLIINDTARKLVGLDGVKIR